METAGWITLSCFIPKGFMVVAHPISVNGRTTSFGMLATVTAAASGHLGEIADLLLERTNLAL